MEERSSKRPQPSGDWKPYERDEEQTARSADSDSSAAGPNQEAKAAEEGQRSDSDRRDSEHKPSTVDAMGQEKHREVTGKRYGLSRGRQFLYYGLFVAFVIAAYIGLKAATDSLDKAPAKDRDQAPWSKPNAPGEPLGGFQPDSPGQKGATDFQ